MSAARRSISRKAETGIGQAQRDGPRSGPWRGWSLVLGAWSWARWTRPCRGRRPVAYGRVKPYGCSRRPAP
eukprot:3503950-Prymnesium_polylepis.1